jgi:hypothetical protein
MRAFSSGTAGPVLGHLLLGLIDLAAGWLLSCLTDHEVPRLSDQRCLK